MPSARSFAEVGDPWQRYQGTSSSMISPIVTGFTSPMALSVSLASFTGGFGLVAGLVPQTAPVLSQQARQTVRQSAVLAWLQSPGCLRLAFSSR